MLIAEKSFVKCKILGQSLVRGRHKFVSDSPGLDHDVNVLFLVRMKKCGKFSGKVLILDFT